MSQHHPLFPVNLQTEWQSPDNHHLDDNLLDWLLESSSLTAKLKKHCEHFRVKVLGQKVEPCHPLEANESIKVGEDVLVREVLLYCDDIPHVFARSLLPLSSLTGEEQILENLGEQSLGQVLFNNAKLERKTIGISPFESKTSVVNLAESLGFNSQKKLWGRRSVFYVQDKPLMVAEVFLPGSFAYQQGLKVNE